MPNQQRTEMIPKGRFNAHFDKSPRDYERLAKYGVNRAEDRLWDMYDWFQKRFYEDEPIHAGLFDLNRYYYKAK